MAFDKAQAHLAARGFADRIQEFDVSSATVALAAAALGCDGSRIAKTISLHGSDGVILVVTAGDRKIDNSRFKAQFGVKAKMLTFEEVEPLIGHGVGGVCPFGVNEGVQVFLDESLKRFDIIYPACGSSNSAVKLTPAELEAAAAPCTWVDVCKEM